MITLQFVTSTWSPASAFIRYWTFSEYSHVDFVMPDGQLLGSHLSGGVKVRPANYAHFSKVLRVTADVPDSVLEAAVSQIGKPYDWQAIVNFFAQRDWREDDSWFCSELVAWSFEKAGYPLFNPATQVWRLTPRDLLLAPTLHY